MRRTIGWLGALLLALQLGLVGGAAPVGAANWQDAGTLPEGWLKTGDFRSTFSNPQAVLLADGRVLVVDLYAAAIRSNAGGGWAAVGIDVPKPFDRPLDGGRLIALADGQALYAGGRPATIVANGALLTRQVLRFDPARNIWRDEGEMPTARAYHTMTTLADGRILVVGGSVPGYSPTAPVKTVGEVELYDPATKTWTPTAPLGQPRYGHTATRLADGRVLVIGGAVSKTERSTNVGSEAVTTAEIYAPSTGTWQAAAPPSKVRGEYNPTLLLDGTVLVVGPDGTGVAAERYDPRTNSWSPAGVPGNRAFYKTLLLPGGEVLALGAANTQTNPVAFAARYTPATNNWQPAPAMNVARPGHATVLVAGQVLAIGGSGEAASRSAERYDATPAGALCYGETGRCMANEFLAYWQAHGQLAINGFPLSEPFAEQLEDGKVYTVQYFERVRMEYHPEQTDPQFRVLLGQFGRRIHPADPGVGPKFVGRYFPETGHNLEGDFLAYWEANGGLAQFGFPLTEVISETLEDGKVYRVQYFERARLEYHPENAAPYDVLLGQFGRRILAGR